MSMRTWAAYGCGLVLTGEEVQKFVESKGFNDPYDFIESERYDHADSDMYPCAEYFGDDFSGHEFHSVTHESVEPEEALVFWADHQPSLFKPAYKNLDEIIAEFKKGLGEDLFKSDEEWANHIGEFSCVVWS